MTARNTLQQALPITWQRSKLLPLNTLLSLRFMASAQSVQGKDLLHKGNWKISKPCVGLKTKKEKV
jgi:hypothetical protein